MKRRRRLIRLAQLLGGLVLAVAASAAGYVCWTYHGPAAPVEAYRGITYSCERLPETDESGGLLHLARIDLTVRGVRFYITPLDPRAAANGWQFPLRYVNDVVRRQNLAVAVNGTLFWSRDPLYVRLSGDWAHALETVVADHVVSHVWEHTYLLWWDDLNRAHLETTKPPSPAALAGARWGIGGQYALLFDGHVQDGAGHQPDRRTIIAADPQRRLVWLAVFDRASFAFAGQTMLQKGATVGLPVDGGGSCSMALGPDAVGVRGGRVVGCWRPVADVFGFYADPVARTK